MTVDQIPIGRFSVITRLSKKALHIYDSKGILVPEAKDPFTGYRYYTGAQIQQGVKIKQLSSLGFSLGEIKQYLEAEKDKNASNIEQLLDKRLKQAEQELDVIQRVVSLLRTDQKEIVKNSMSEPLIKETTPLRILSKREKGTYDATIGKLIGELMKVIHLPENQRNFVKIAGPFMTIYHDEGHIEENADIEVAIPITGKVSVEDPGIEIRNMKPTKVASLIHKGSYETIGEGYRKILSYIQNRGLEINGPIMDLYLNDPNTVKPDDIITEIQVPIK
jgi:effector-binding domain-containing protein